MGVPLRAIADHSYFLAANQGWVSIFIVINCSHSRSLLYAIVSICARRVTYAKRVAAHHRYLPCAHHFQDTDWLEQLQQALDFILGTCAFYDHRLWSHIDDLCAEDGCQVGYFSSSFGTRFYLDQGQVARHNRLVGNILYIDDVNQLI